jgi:hypothetical protein
VTPSRLAATACVTFHDSTTSRVALERSERAFMFTFTAMAAESSIAYLIMLYPFAHKSNPVVLSVKLLN